MGEVRWHVFGVQIEVLQLEEKKEHKALLAKVEGMLLWVEEVLTSTWKDASLFNESFHVDQFTYIYILR